MQLTRAISQPRVGGPVDPAADLPTVDYERFQPLWRAHTDAVNRALLARWLPAGTARHVLKTDLFDEAVSPGLYPFVASRCVSFTGVDVCEATVRAAGERHPAMETVRADVRALPFATGQFDVVVSTSTLDHFTTLEDLDRALRELHRVLEPGGLLLLTLDNLANPIVALRNALPSETLQRLGLVPYYVGATYGPGRLQQVLRARGFEVHDTSTMIHCPRFLCVAAAAAVERTGPAVQRRFLRGLWAFESLGRLPFRHLTGHFVCVQARSV